MDFMERLVDNVNSIGLPIECKLGYLTTAESFCLYPLPGSKVAQEYYGGQKDQQLNYGFEMKSTDQAKIHTTLWNVQSHLEELRELASEDGSFEFDGINVTSKPFISQLDDKEEYIFILNIQANITTKGDI